MRLCQGGSHGHLICSVRTLLTGHIPKGREENGQGPGAVEDGRQGGGGTRDPVHVRQMRTKLFT